MSKQSPHPTPESEEFNELIALLQSHDIPPKEVCIALGMKTKDQKPDLPTLLKLRSGVSHSYNKKPTSALIATLKSIVKFKGIFDQWVVDYSQFDKMYLAYYWSNVQSIELLVLGIYKNSSDHGEAIYLRKSDSGSYVPLRRKKIEKVNYIPKSVIEFRIRKNEDSPTTFIAANISGNDIDDCKYFYFSYCGSTGIDNRAYAGIGIMESVDSTKYRNRIKELANGIPYTVFNALYTRRNIQGTNEDSIYDKIEQIRSKQVKCLQSINGYWCAYYARKDITKAGVNGGLQKAIVHISLSGEIRVYHHESKLNGNIKENYMGIVRFPYSNNTSMISAELEFYKVTHRVQILFNFTTARLTGIMNGWRERSDNRIFTRVILCERITTESNQFNEKTILSLYDSIKPGEYSHKETDQFHTQLNVIEYAEKSLIHSLKGCKIKIPKNYTMKDQLAIFQIPQTAMGKANYDKKHK